MAMDDETKTQDPTSAMIPEADRNRGACPGGAWMEYARIRPTSCPSLRVARSLARRMGDLPARQTSGGSRCLTSLGSGRAPICRTNHHAEDSVLGTTCQVRSNTDAELIPHCCIFDPIQGSLKGTLSHRHTDISTCALLNGPAVTRSKEECSVLDVGKPGRLMDNTTDGVKLQSPQVHVCALTARRCCMSVCRPEQQHSRP